jgi:hypothetical protein
VRVGWLADHGNVDGTGFGGAELTQSEFRIAAPDGVEIVPVLRQDDGSYNLEDLETCDMACVFNVALYPKETLAALQGLRVVRYWSDVAPHGDRDLTVWLLGNATNVFTSPLHYERFPWRNGTEPEYHLIPPAVPLGLFREAAERTQGRAGTVSIAPWRGRGKTPRLVQEWAKENGPVDFYGGGSQAPAGSMHLSYAQIPDLLARYERFIYLPTALEPFCRLAVEAHAAGCEVIVNNLVGARYWIQEKPEALDTAAEDFWKLVLR